MKFSRFFLVPLTQVDAPRDTSSTVGLVLCRGVDTLGLHHHPQLCTGTGTGAVASNPFPLFHSSYFPFVPQKWRGEFHHTHVKLGQTQTYLFRKKYIFLKIKQVRMILYRCILYFAHWCSIHLLYITLVREVRAKNRL